MRSRFLAFLLVLSMLPASGEIVDLVMRLATRGDVAQVVSDAHDQTPPGSDERGCSGLFHLCSCHNAQVTMTASGTAIAKPSPHDRVIDAHAPTPDRGRGAPPPPIRPPIS